MISPIDYTGLWPTRRCLVRDLKPGMALAVRLGGNKLIRITELIPDGENYTVVVMDDDRRFSYPNSGPIGIDAFEGIDAS
jgi:hypothetical protein